MITHNSGMPSLRIFSWRFSYGLAHRMDKDDGRHKESINYEKQDHDNTLNEKESSKEVSYEGVTHPGGSNQNLNDWAFVFKRCVAWTCFISLIALSVWVVFYPKLSDYIVDVNTTRGIAYIAIYFILKYQPHPQCQS